jgi:hypothetical protein
VNDFNTPIYAILTDLEHFEFYQFERTGDNRVFRAGKCEDFWRIHMGLQIDGNEVVKRQFIRGLRPVCEMIFSVALRAYQQSLIARSNKIQVRAAAEGRGLWGKGDWVQAQIHAQAAIDLAEAAADEVSRVRGSVPPCDISSPTAEIFDLHRQVAQLVGSAADNLRKRYVI